MKFLKIDKSFDILLTGSISINYGTLLNNG